MTGRNRRTGAWAVLLVLAAVALVAGVFVAMLVKLGVTTSHHQAEPPPVSIHSIVRHRNGIHRYRYRPGMERHLAVPYSRLAGRVTFCPILMYHYIRVNPVPSDILGLHLSVTPYEFNQQMKYLRNHGNHAVSLARLARHIRYGASLPRKPFVITLDDGYRDAYTAAFPILKRYHFHATFFIVTGFVGTPRYVTWNQIHRMDRAGMEIGVHTLDHMDLTIQPGWRVWQEIHRSKIEIEHHLHHAVWTFAYPSGAFNQLALQDVHRVGYLAAVSTNPGTLHSQTTINYLARVRVLDSDTPYSLSSTMATGFGNAFSPPVSPP
jgi:peptidoglycan/xylan/chitin deacetylase (PgdA/CDA1 family)